MTPDALPAVAEIQGGHPLLRPRRGGVVPQNCQINCRYRIWVYLRCLIINSTSILFYPLAFEEGAPSKARSVTAFHLDTSNPICFCTYVNILIYLYF